MKNFSLKTGSHLQVQGIRTWTYIFRGHHSTNYSCDCKLKFQIASISTNRDVLIWGLNYMSFYVQKNVFCVLVGTEGNCISALIPVDPRWQQHKTCLSPFLFHLTKLSLHGHLSKGPTLSCACVKRMNQIFQIQFQ